MTLSTGKGLKFLARVGLLKTPGTDWKDKEGDSKMEGGRETDSVSGEMRRH
jgi:hypothetical protein